MVVSCMDEWSDVIQNSTHAALFMTFNDNMLTPVIRQQLLLPPLPHRGIS